MCIRRENKGVILESQGPHLIVLDDDVLSRGLFIYRLMVRLTFKVVSYFCRDSYMYLFVRKKHYYFQELHDS